MSQIPTPKTLPRFHRLALFSLVAVALAATACGTSIGDECSTNADCPAGSYCDRAMPDGMCTISNCRPSHCPDGSICVEFYNGERFCMPTCGSDGDCREGYSCIKDVGPDPFCSVLVK